RADPMGPGIQDSGVHTLPPQAAHPGRGGLPDLSWADRAYAGRRRQDRPTLDERSGDPGGAPPAAAAVVDGVVRGLPPAAERHAGHPGAARLRRLPPLSAASSIVGLTVYATVNARHCLRRTREN